MPRDVSGNYSLPSGVNPVVSDTVIDVAWANTTLNDIATQLNNVITRDGLLGFTGALKVVDGAVGAPGYAFSSAASTGMYRTGTFLGLAWAGTLRFSVDGTGAAVAGTLSATSFSGPLTGNVTGNVTGSSGSCTGNAATATNVAASGLTGATLAAGVTASSLTSFGANIALGTPASGNLANCTFPTLNQNTTGSAGSVAAANITGTTLASNVTASSLTSFGTNPTATTQSTGDNSTRIATTAFVKSLSYAPLASPTFTGTVTAPAFSGALTGNVTGNVTGSSGSCTGNAATATTAGYITNSAYNGFGVRTVSTSAPSGGSDGDVWYRY